MFDNEDINKRIELRENRHELVVKSNDLLRNTRYSLNATEQKLLIFIISKIAAEDTDFKEVEISVKDYCKLTGIAVNGSVYNRIKQEIKSLADKSWWIPTGEKKEFLFRWIDKAEIEQGNGVMYLKLHDNLKPFLLQLRENFTKYELINILTLKGKYAIRLYELLKSYLWQGHWEIKIDELRKLIDTGEKYKEFKEFNRSVLTPAIEEINKYTDLQVAYKTVKSGKTVRDIYFSIEEKQGIQLGMDLMFNQRERLNEKW